MQHCKKYDSTSLQYPQPKIAFDKMLRGGTILTEKEGLVFNEKIKKKL